MFAIRPPTLWQDEAYWAVKAVNTAAIDAQIRPLGFMLVTQLLLRIFGAAAWVYRLLPFLGSLLSMSLSGYVATRLFKKPWAQLLAVLLLAVSPVALEMGVEFKHYGVEVGVYIGVLAAFLNFRDQASWRSLALLLGVAWLSFFFSITIIFCYPALFGILLWRAYSNKQTRRLIAVAATAAICLGTIGTIYFTTWRGISANKAEKKWGTWYDVFYIQDGLRTTHHSRLAWTTAKYFELASVAGVDRQLWQTERVSESALERLKSADLLLWGALHLAGIAWLVRRRRYEDLLVLWSPLLCVTLFNLAGRWPAGAFRTNTFYVPFSICLSAFASEWLPDERPRQARLAFGLSAVLWLSAVVFRPSLTAKGLWTRPGAITEALQLLPLKAPKGERALVMDFESCRPWSYYTAIDEPFAKRGKALRGLYKETCLRTERLLVSEVARRARTEKGLTVLLTDPRKYAAVEGAIKRSCATSTATYVHGRTHLVLTCRTGN